MQTHTHTYSVATDRKRFAITSWKEKKSSKGLYFNKKSEEKLQKILIVESFEGDDEKAQYANFKHIFI